RLLVGLEIALGAEVGDRDVRLLAAGPAALAHEAVVRLVAPVPVVLEVGAELLGELGGGIHDDGRGHGGAHSKEFRTSWPPAGTRRRGRRRARSAARA